MINNTIVLDILNNQNYKNLNLDCKVSDYEFNNSEHVFVYYDGEKLNFFLHKDASHVIKIRLNIIVPYIEPYFNIIKPNRPISFILGLGDSDEKSHNKNIPIICFTKKSNLNNILIPNIDFFMGTMITQIINVSNNDIDFNKKIDGSCFAGSSTGTMIDNKRVRYCLKMAGKENHFAKITDITQGSLSEWKSIFPKIESIIENNYYNIQNQLQYKILINIDGNTLCYSRLYWQILSNSAVVYLEPDTSYTQFFDTKILSNFYFSSSLNNIDNIHNYILDKNNEDKIIKMKIEGKKYLQNCFEDYINNKEKFLSSILVYILHELIENNT
jgi:hypothetical protein